MRSRRAVRSFILFQLDFLQEEELRSRLRSWRVNVRQRSPFEVTILFVPVSAGLEQLASCWADDCDQIILRLCPICQRDSIVGHGHRRKQAHDEHHDWIGIRRGRCSTCGKTFTFLPLFSLPYTHFSLFARCQALWRRIKEHCSWERASPKLKDPDRVPDTRRHIPAHLAFPGRPQFNDGRGQRSSCASPAPLGSTQLYPNAIQPRYW